MHAPQRGAYACRIRWIINADHCKRRLAEPIVRIHRALQAICRGQAEPAAVRQGMRGRAGSSSSASAQRVADIFVLNACACIHVELGAAEQRTEWFKRPLQRTVSRTTVRVRASCSCSEACSCVTAEVSSVGTGSAGVFMSARVFAPTSPRASRVCAPAPRPTSLLAAQFRPRWSLSGERQRTNRTCRLPYLLTYCRSDQ
jgi:hypothetical protein